MQAGAPKRDLAGTARFGLYLALFILVFHRFWDQALVYRDSFVFFAPNKFIIADGLRHWRLDLWNPWVLLGLPLAGEVQAGLFYPLNLLFAVLPFGIAHRLFVFLHYPLAAFGMDLFLRGRGLSRRAALFGGLAFALSGYLVSQHGLVRMTLGGAWLPLVLYCFDRSARERFFAAAAGAALAAQVLACDPETALISAALGAALALEGAVRERRPAGGLAAVALTAVAAFALAAIAVLPAREMLALTTRAGGIALKEAVVFSFHPAQAIEFIWPTPYGTNWPEYNFWGQFAVAINPAKVNVPWSASNYLGFPVAALVVAGMVLGRPRWRWTWLGCAGFFLLLAFGRYTPVYGWVHAVAPVFNSIRYPSKFIVFVTFFLAALSAVGLDALLSDLHGRAAQRAATAFLAAAAAGAGLMYFLWPRAMLYRSLFRPGSPLFNSGMEDFAANWKQWVVVNAAVGLAGILLTRNRLSPRLGLPLIGAVILVDWWLASVAIMPTGPADIYEFTPVAESAIARVEPPTPGQYRIFQGKMEFHDLNPALADMSTETRQQVWFRNVLSPNLAALSRIESMRGYDSYDFRAEGRLLDRDAERWVMEMFNVRFVLDQGSDPVKRGELAYFDPLNELRIVKLLDAWPRAYFVARPLAARDADESRQLLARAWAGRTAVIVGAEDGGTDGGPLVPAVVESYTPDRVRVGVDAPSAGWLVLSDRFFPGWTATVDGRPREIHRANVLVRAVQVGPGRHEVEFRYRPRSVLLGELISLPAWALFGGMWFRRARRRATSPAR